MTELTEESFGQHLDSLLSHVSGDLIDQDMIDFVGRINGIENRGGIKAGVLVYRTELPKTVKYSRDYSDHLGLYGRSKVNKKMSEIEENNTLNFQTPAVFLFLMKDGSIETVFS